MRLGNPVSAFASHSRPAIGRTSRSRMRAPSRLPTLYPTRSSYLQRLLWWLGFGR